MAADSAQTVEARPLRQIIGAPPCETQGRAWTCTQPARPLFQGVVNDNNTPQEAIMTKSRKGRSADPRQTDFLSLLSAGISLLPAPIPPRTDPGALNMDRRLRELLNEAIAVSGMDRATIAAELTPLAGRPISKAQIDSWTGATRPNRFPADLIPALCAVLGNAILLQGLAEAVGCTLVEGYTMQLARLGQLLMFINQAKVEQDTIIANLPLYRQAVRHG
jgi:hypothetical protein